MSKDPFTLLIVADKNGDASGDLYVDDGETFAHIDGNYAWNKVEMKGYTTIRSSKRTPFVSEDARGVYSKKEEYQKVYPFAEPRGGAKDEFKNSVIEKIVIWNMKPPKRVLYKSQPLDFHYQPNKLIIIKIKPGLLVGDEFEIKFE
jgi:alpha 1,3-glucosidase